MLLLLGGLLIIWQWQLHKSSQFYFEWRSPSAHLLHDSENKLPISSWK